jgi:ATP-dependent Clp protease ATP-binding subunit ClpB
VRARSIWRLNGAPSICREGRAGDSFVTVERLLLGLSSEGSEAATILSKGGVTPQNLNAAIEVVQGLHGFSRRKMPATAESCARDLTQAARGA